MQLLIKNPTIFFNLKNNVYIPLFPLYTDGGLFNIYEGTDGYHSEYFDNCISNIFSLKNSKPFYLIDYRDINTLAAVYYKLSSEDYYLRSINYKFPTDFEYIKKYKQQFKKFFKIFMELKNSNLYKFILESNNASTENKNEVFSEFNYFLFLFHNNIGPLYNDDEVFLDRDDFFPIDAINNKEDENSINYSGLYNFNDNKAYLKGIEMYSQFDVEDKEDLEFKESLSIKNFKQNSIHFVLKNLFLLSLIKGVKFFIYVSDDKEFIEFKKCKENMKNLYEDYNNFFKSFAKTDNQGSQVDLEKSKKSKIYFDKHDFEFDEKNPKYTNKLNFKNLPEKDYDISFESLKNLKEFILFKKEEENIRYLEFNLSNKFFEKKILKPLIYIEILENSEFYILNIFQYFISRFINIQEIRGINPYNKNLIGIDYEEPLDQLVEEGIWINSWDLKTIPKIIPFGSLIDI